MYSIYVHTTPDGRRYVGATGRRPKDRWDSGWGYHGTPFWEAIQKYGWKAIEHKVLFQVADSDIADHLERAMIAYYNSADPEYGYNSESGGVRGKTIPPALRQRVSETIKTKGIAPPSRAGFGKPVEQYTIDGEYIQTFPMLKDAAASIGRCYQTVLSVIQGKSRTAGGFKWKYAKEASNDHKQAAG